MVKGCLQGDGGNGVYLEMVVMGCLQRDGGNGVSTGIWW